MISLLNKNCKWKGKFYKWNKMFNVNRIHFLLCATLLIHWTSASPSSRFNARSAQSGRGSMAGESSSTAMFWYEIRKKYFTISSSLTEFFKHCNNHKIIYKRLEKFILRFRCSRTQDLVLQMCQFFFSILNNFA